MPAGDGAIKPGWLEVECQEQQLEASASGNFGSSVARVHASITFWSLSARAVLKDPSHNGLVLPQADAAKALAHPLRAAILKALEDREASPVEQAREM
jgi:hypothetical protein